MSDNTQMAFIYALSDAVKSSSVGDRIVLFIESVWVTMRVIILKWPLYDSLSDAFESALVRDRVALFIRLNGMPEYQSTVCRRQVPFNQLRIEGDTKSVIVCSFNAKTSAASPKM